MGLDEWARGRWRGLAVPRRPSGKKRPHKIVAALGALAAGALLGALAPAALAERVYVTNFFDPPSISAYDVAKPTGTLTEIAGSPFSVNAGQIIGTSATANGKYLYTASSDSTDAVASLRVNRKTGALTDIASPFSVEDNPFQTAIAQGGKRLYVMNQGISVQSVNGSISAFDIDPRTGELDEIEGSPFDAGNGTSGMALTPNGKYLYVGAGNAQLVAAMFVFRVDRRTGRLTQVVGSPFELPDPAMTPGNPAFSSDGRRMYLLDTLGSVVWAFDLDKRSGVPTQIPGAPYSAGPVSDNLALSPNGKHLYVVNFVAANPPCEGGSISVFDVNRRTGALNAISGSPFPQTTCPFNLGISGGGRFLYTVSWLAGQNGNISTFELDQQTGAPSLVGSPLAAGLQPATVTFVR